MAKDNDSEAKARQKLADAQAKLRSAEEKRKRIIAKGEAQLKRARKKTEQAVVEITARVEQRAAAVAKAEARLLALRGDGSVSSPSGAPSEAELGIAPASAEEAADRLEAMGSSAEPLDGSPVPIVEAPDSTTSSGA